MAPDHRIYTQLFLKLNRDKCFSNHYAFQIIILVEYVEHRFEKRLINLKSLFNKNARHKIRLTQLGRTPKNITSIEMKKEAFKAC